MIGWEMGFLQTFLGLLYSIQLFNLVGMVRIECAGYQIGVVVLDLSLIIRFLIPPSIDFPWKSIWKVKVSTKVAFFTWTAARGRILNMNNLRKHHVCIVISVVCVRRMG